MGNEHAYSNNPTEESKKIQNYMSFHDRLNHHKNTTSNREQNLSVTINGQCKCVYDNNSTIQNQNMYGCMLENNVWLQSAIHNRVSEIHDITRYLHHTYTTLYAQIKIFATSVKILKQHCTTTS